MSDLFSGKAVGRLATPMPDGSPRVTPVWVDRGGDLILVNTTKGRSKDRNMRARATVALEFADPGNPNRYVALRGEGVRVREGGDDPIARRAKRYLGQDKYPYRHPGEVRVVIAIRPERVLTFAQVGAAAQRRIRCPGGTRHRKRFSAF